MPWLHEPSVRPDSGACRVRGTQRWPDGSTGSRRAPPGSAGEHATPHVAHARAYACMRCSTCAAQLAACTAAAIHASLPRCSHAQGDSSMVLDAVMFRRGSSSRDLTLQYYIASQLLTQFDHVDFQFVPRQVAHAAAALAQGRAYVCCTPCVTVCLLVCMCSGCARNHPLPPLDAAAACMLPACMSSGRPTRWLTGWPTSRWTLTLHCTRCYARTSAASMRCACSQRQRESTSSRCGAAAAAGATAGVRVMAAGVT